MKRKLEKRKYVTPRTEVIEMENEGNVMSASINGWTPGSPGLPGPSSKRPNSYNASSLSELEELISDILTF